MDPLEFASDVRPAFDAWAAPHLVARPFVIAGGKTPRRRISAGRLGGSSNRQLLLNVANVLKECDRVKLRKDGLQLLLP